MSESQHTLTELYHTSLEKLMPVPDGACMLHPNGSIAIEMQASQKGNALKFVAGSILCFMITAAGFSADALNVVLLSFLIGVVLFFAAFMSGTSQTININISETQMSITVRDPSNRKSCGWSAVFPWNRYYIKSLINGRSLTVIVGDRKETFDIINYTQRYWMTDLFEQLNFPAWVPPEEIESRKPLVQTYARNETPLRPSMCVALAPTVPETRGDSWSPNPFINAAPKAEFVYDPSRYIDAVVPNDTTPMIDAVLQNPPVFDDDTFRPAPAEHAALNEKYHNLTPIGGGAQASMFRALDQQNHPVGIKVYDFSTFQSWKDQDLFEREVKILQTLDFKGIPRFVELIENSPNYYLVESYIPAPSLDKRIKNKEQITFDNVLLLLVNIAEILNYLETRIPPVIHRDIKPENLLVDDNFNVWLVDFGVVAAEAQKTNAMTFAGTAGYMAPEQVTGKVTPAADIYAVGISILALLTGKTPADMKFQGLSVDVRAELPYYLPEWFKRLLIDMTHPIPSQRIQNAAQIICVISDYMSYNTLAEYTGDEHLIRAAGAGIENAVYDQNYVEQQLEEVRRKRYNLQL